MMITSFFFHNNITYFDMNHKNFDSGFVAANRGIADYYTIDSCVFDVIILGT